MQNVLRDIQRGMKVFDSTRAEIGTVDWVRFGEDDPETPEVESASLPVEPHAATLVEGFLAAFTSEDMPEEVRERLLQDGFVRIDANGLFSADRYVTPGQIQGVSSEGVLLRVSKSELMKRH